MQQEKDLHIFDQAFALRTSLFWVFFAWTAFGLSLLGIFHEWILLTILVTGIATFFYVAIKQCWFRSLSWEYWTVLAFSILMAVAIASFSTPTIFSGRDQGAISEAAILLAQNHSLLSSSDVSQTFFEIYGPGKALNFPGFHYTDSGKLITQFPIGYISWLGAWYAVFGIIGFLIANAILLAISLFSGYFFVRNFLSPAFSFLFLLFFTTSFSLVWFSRFTLSENLALALIMTLLAALVPLLRNPSGDKLVTFLFSASLLVFVRIEGIVILGTSMVVILFSQKARSYFMSKLRPYMFYLFIAFIIIFAINVYQDRAFYLEIGKVIESTIKSSTVSSDINSSINSISHYINNVRIWSIYGIFGFILLGMSCVIFLFIRGYFFQLAPFFVTITTFYYFIDSHISSDYPWMLRRFAFASLPVSIFYSTLLISFLFKNKAKTFAFRVISISSAVILSILLLLSNLYSTLPIATYSENRNLLKQTGSLSSKFSDKDLVLVDRMSSGDAWAMLSGPMRFVYGKNAVYFFNPYDLEKLNFSRFKKIYLVIPQESLGNYAEISGRLTEVEPYELNTNRLDVHDADSVSQISIAKKKNVNITGKIFLYEPKQ